VPTTPSPSKRLSPQRLIQIRAATAEEEIGTQDGTIDISDPIAEAMYSVIRELMAHISALEGAE
jgi:type III secretion system FlhB-like substrate exporter